MKSFEQERNSHPGVGLFGKVGALVLLVTVAAAMLDAQTATQADVAERVAQLTDAMARTQAQLERSQHDLDQMRQQLNELQREMVANGTATPATSPAAPDKTGSPAVASADASESTAGAIDDLRERQAIQESEIATQEQTKVESESKYPVKVTGLLLMSGFINSSAVDTAATPSVAIGGLGSAGATVRQTVLGFDARGPHLFGASSFADLRVDFYGSQAAGAPATSYSGYYNTSSVLRLRTAHAGLDWNRTQVYFALDHPIINPEAPSSLTATAVPALAWSGNLWTWNPQAGITTSFAPNGSSGIQLQAALIDTGDAPLTPAVAPSSTVIYVPPTGAEQSSKPGVEARVAWFGPGQDDSRMHIGVGGYFAEHDSALGRNYDSWASTLDARLSLGSHLELTGNFYRGAALGGLGAGGYKDFVYSPNISTGGYYFRPLDDVGGWAQLKARATERLELNAAYGMDNVFAGQLRRYYIQGGSMIQNLELNRTFTGNVIYSPSAYLLLSVEYRRLQSTAVEDTGAASNIIGVGAGYRF
ncbi:MAG: hypothetical protein WDM87_17745 [Terracidiphilus sp.]